MNDFDQKKQNDLHGTTKLLFQCSFSKRKRELVYVQKRKWSPTKSIWKAKKLGCCFRKKI